MDFLTLAKNRKTTYQFSGKQIKESGLNKILEAGRWAPSSHNSQPWKFIVVRDRAKIRKLMRISFYGGYHSSPPIIICLVLEPMYAKMRGLLNGRFAQYAPSHKYMNIAMPLANMIYEAQALGIGSGILSPEVPAANKLLGVPAGSEAIIMLALGYEEKGAFQKPRHRKGIGEIVRHEKYRA